MEDPRAIDQRRSSTYRKAAPRRWEVPTLAFSAASLVATAELGPVAFAIGIVLAVAVLISLAIRTFSSGVLVHPWSSPPPGTKIVRNPKLVLTAVALTAAAAVGVVALLATGGDGYLLPLTVLLMALAATMFSISSHPSSPDEAM